MQRPIPFGKYYLLDRISVGGMAEVFKAKAFGVEGFERLLAVKRILPSIAEDEEFITMFIDEAKIAVQLQHANIAQIFDLGKVGDAYFIALEYVSGRDIRSIFDRMRKLGRGLPVPMACYITMKMCEGLDYAHNKKDSAGRDLNLVHRDVSPQNVLLSYDGEVKVIDFGIAKAAGKAGKTQAGILKGKFGYMSPEQVRGLPLDRRSDIFAVGICLWEMVCGERLFIGQSDFSTLEKVRNVDIHPPSDVREDIPEELEQIILKALAKEVEDRYQNALDLHDDLQSWMYSSGNFFARKDLMSVMDELFHDEIERERETNDIPTDADLVAEFDDSVEAMARPSVPPPAPRGPSLPPGVGPSMPPPPPGSGSHSGPHGRSANTLNVPTARGATGTGQAPLTLDWDDEDEPPTNIYSKRAAAEMAKAVVNQGTGSDVVPSGFPSQISQVTMAPRRPWVPVVIVLLALAVLGIGGLVLYPRLFASEVGQLELAVTPSDKLQVFIDGSFKLQGSDAPFLPNLKTGRHVVTVKRGGYKTQQIEINIEGGAKISRAVSLARLPTGFYLDTEPPGATVWVNDRPLEEKTPVTVSDLEPGMYSVRVAKGDSFAQKNIEVSVTSGEINRLPTKVLELKAVEVTFKTRPAGAEATLISGNVRRKLGSTPISALLEPTETYKISYSMDGYDSTTRNVEFDGSREAVVLPLVSLTALDGKPSSGSVSRSRRNKHKGKANAGGKAGSLSVQTRPWSKVFIDGNFIKNTPVIKHKLAPGSYTVTVENPTYSIKKSFRVQIKAGQNTPLVKTLM